MLYEVITRNKFVDPHYTMLWAEDIPVRLEKDDQGREISIRIIAGDLHGDSALKPAPNSWAADPASHVAIWIITLAPGAVWKLPEAPADAERTLYCYEGSSLTADGTEIPRITSYNVCYTKLLRGLFV